MKVYTFDNKVLTHDSKWLKEATPAPLPPIPANSIRVRTSDGNVPYKAEGITNYTTATLVTGTTDVYDVYKSGTNFNQVLCKSNNVTEVLGANITSVTNISSLFAQCTSLITVQLFDTSNATNMQSMFNTCSSLTVVPLFDISSASNVQGMFGGCSSLTSVPLLDTSNATNMSFMFSGCSSLTSVPLLDTSKVTNVQRMFYECINVQSGALALYQQVSNQTTPPSSHNYMFTNCGSNTVTGAAELAQIPSGWGGTAS